MTLLMEEHTGPGQDLSIQDERIKRGREYVLKGPRESGCHGIDH